MSRRRQLLSTLAAWPVVAIGFVVYGRGSFGQVILLVMATAAAVGCWAVGCLFLLQAGRGPSRWERSGRAALIFGTFLVGLWASFPFGIMLKRHDVAAAQAFCEGLIPAVERYRVGTGRYPGNPPAVAEDVAWPRLIDRAQFYRAGTEGYGFHFVDPGGVLSGFVYSSRTGRWHELDVFDLVYDERWWYE